MYILEDVPNRFDDLITFWQDGFDPERYDIEDVRNDIVAYLNWCKLLRNELKNLNVEYNDLLQRALVWKEESGN